jgi:hypothetical protein
LVKERNKQTILYYYIILFQKMFFFSVFKNDKTNPLKNWLIFNILFSIFFNKKNDSLVTLKWSKDLICIKFGLFM